MTLKEEMSARKTLLLQRLKMPLDIKIAFTQRRIREWYYHWDGKVYISFSGGLDSTVVRHIVLDLFPDTPVICVNTGLQYPEIRTFVTQTPNVIVLRPDKSFRQVIEEYGYPVVSKAHAAKIREVQRCGKNSNTVRLRLEGIKRDGSKAKPIAILPKKWHYLCYAPFLISERCCHWLKKRPLVKAGKRYGNPISGMRAAESESRQRFIIRYGCNAFDIKQPIASPLNFWTSEDIRQYLKEFNVPYATIYNNPHYRSTGCMFCMFGVDQEKEPNRFQLMKEDYPKLYRYCIDELGIGKVLDFMNIPYDYIRQPKLL